MRYAHRVYDPEDVDVQAQIVSRPEPMYTEEARLNRVTGQVTLRAVLTDRGQVEGIQVVKDLTDGLTDRAEDAARQIEFVPAMKNGRPVSQRILITYNFDLD
jgi:protein TonB